MNKYLLLSTAVFVALFSAQSAFALNNDTPETVVVTATRMPTPETQIGSSITVITVADIAAKQDQTLPDLLEDVPGLNMVQTGGPGGQSSVFMRGTNSNHVKVLVDGIDVSDPSNSTASFDFGQFLTPDIARVEVLRGPQSGLYGADAIGGVINIITKSGEGPAQFHGDVEGGSFETFNQSAGVSGSTDGFHYSANIEHFFSGATPVTPLDLLMPGEKRNDDSYKNTTFSTKLGFDVTDNFDLGFVGRYSNTFLDYTGDDFNTYPSFPAAEQSQSNTVQYYTRATAHLVSFNGMLDQTLGFAYSSDHTFDADPNNGNSSYAGDRVKVDWQGNVHLTSDEILVLGAEHERDEIRIPLSAAMTLNSGYAELQSTFASNIFNAINIRYDDNDRFGGKTTFREAPVYVIEQTGTKLKASIGTGFKAPTLSELFQNFPSFGFFGNPNLKPETSLGWDAGFEQSLLDQTVQFGATYFHNNIKNLIDLNEAGDSYANIGKALTQGVESFIFYQPIDAVTLRTDYTYTEAIDAELHLELLRRPKHKVTLNGNWQVTPALSFNAELLYVGSFIDANRSFSIPRLTAPGYTTVNIAVSYALTNQFTLYGRIDNLFDKIYQDPVGFLRPGRGYFAGIKANI